MRKIQIGNATIFENNIAAVYQKKGSGIEYVILTLHTPMDKAHINSNPYLLREEGKTNSLMLSPKLTETFLYWLFMEEYIDLEVDLEDEEELNVEEGEQDDD